MNSTFKLLALLAGLLATSIALAHPHAGGPRTVGPQGDLHLGPDQLDLSYYLPQGVDYDSEIPVPEQILGYQVGEWHVRHDQLVTYLTALADSSDRVSIEKTGKTHEARSQLLLTISSAENQGRIETLRQQHLQLSDPAVAAPVIDDMPVVVNLGYSVHGNEASGSNAALVVAYHLTAARGPEIDDLLRQAIILIDPSLNPDGLGRFAHWANMHRGRALVSDPQHREHNEAWPNGRTNHYWFDLNRDWLLAQHPETLSRLEQFHRWKPNVLGDFHEMGSQATYFFQPGVPSRAHPLTPARNIELTAAIAEYHARALDAVGSLYYTEETFDDFYYGKGSTYPDVNGAVGILFEQASVRGHLQESPQGILSFPFAIRNQFLTSLSTLAGAVEKRRQLLEYQRDFYRQPAASDSGAGAHLFGDRDPARLQQMLELLRRHRIEVHRLAKNFSAGQARFEPDSAFLVPEQQPQHRLVRALFERRTEFKDSTFYDVSTWTLPLAFGVESQDVGADDLAGLEGERVDVPSPVEGQIHGAASPPYAYLFAWTDHYAPRALYRLLAEGVRARVATEPFEAETERGRRRFERGTIVVPTGIQPHQPADLAASLAALAKRDGLQIDTVSSGLTAVGIDLGSPSLRPLEQPRPALVVGGGISTYDAGEIWHLLDHHFEIELSHLEVNELSQIDLERYTHLIFVDGDYQRVPEEVTQEIRRWTERGGVLVCTRRAVTWADRKVLVDSGHGAEAEPTTAEQPTAVPRLAYADHEKHSAERLISGAIFEVDLDLTHPLAYGYTRQRLPVFRNSRIILPPATNPYTTVARYTDAPLLSGYVSSENYSRLQGTPALTARRVGDGVVVRMVDNPNFRAIWYGTQKLFLNSLFMAPIIEDTSD